MLMQRIIEWIRKTLNRRRAAPVNTCQSSCSLERRLNEWTQKVLEAQTPATSNAAASMADTYHMILDVDRIIAEEFDRIAAAPSRLLEQFAGDKDFRILSALVEKGISGGPNAWRILHMLTCQKQDCWIAEDMLKKRMWVDTNDYGALHACVQNDAVEVCKLLLDGGMDFDQYRQWAETHSCASHEDTLQALAEHWAELKAAQAQGENGAPAGAQRSGSGGERSHSEMSELAPQAEASDMELVATTGGMTLG